MSELFSGRSVARFIVASVFVSLAVPGFAQDNGANSFPKANVQTPPPNSTPPVTPGNVTALSIPSPLNLRDAIDLSLRLQPNVAIAVANRQENEQRQKQAQSRYFPTITPSYTRTYQYTYGRSQQFVTSPSGGTTTSGGTTVGGTTTGTGTTGTGTTGTGTTGTGTTGTGTTGTGTTGTGTTGTGTSGFGTSSTQVVYVGNTTDTHRGQLALAYTLYDSGIRELNARSARQSVRVSLYNEANTRQTTIGTVAQDYFTALRTDALVKVSEANVARAQNTLDVVTAQVAAGTSPQKDTFQARADLLNAQVALLQAQNNAEIAQANLKNAIGVVGGERLQLAPLPAPASNTPSTASLDANSPPAASLNGAASTAEINRFADLAYRSRPDIAQQQENVDVSKTNVAIARVNAGLNVSSQVALTYQGDPSNGDNRSINLAVSYPLFDGGETRSVVRQNQAAQRLSEAQLTQLRQQVAVEVEQAYRTLSQTRATLPATQAAQEAAQVNYDAAIASRREGVGSIVDVITAQTALVQAQQNYVQAIYDFYIADAALARNVGQADRIGR